MSKSYYLSLPLPSTFTRFGAGLYLVFADVPDSNQSIHQLYRFGSHLHT